MDGERWQRVEKVLDLALASEPARWTEILDTSCAADPELRREVEDLLRRISTAEGFLENRPDALAAELIRESSEAPPAAAESGRRIGAYRLVREIGRGGMSRVFLAERADGHFRNEVALKLLRPGLDSEIDQERFRAERQILASLNHPHIARLLDGGVTEEGLPYLVLEHVDGVAIDRYCFERSLPVRERLSLFLTVAEAIQHAHRSLVIHRDLKPTNILVTPEGRVKLLDFGLAKLLQSDASGATARTTRIGQRWMTPEYAAPEQVSSGTVTTLTDVYQLGAVLYELLTGRVPFAGATLRELERAILDRDPLAPSAVVVRGAGAAPADANDAAGEDTRPSRKERQPLARALRGDLDAIVLKALRKEPGERYVSVESMAEDVRRYLAGEPVRARRQTAAYLARRFAARHRAALAAAAAGTLLLAGAGLRERKLRRLAEGEAAKARAVGDYLVSVFEVADPYAHRPAGAGEVTARELLDRGAARIDETLVGQPEVQAEMRRVLGQVYMNLGLYDTAAPLLERALEQRRSLHRATHPAVTAVMDGLGRVLTSQNRFDEAEPLLVEALEQRRKTAPLSAALAESLDHLATLYQERHEYAQAEPLFREAVTIRERLHGPAAPSVASSLNNLAVLHFMRGEYDEAEPLYRRVLEIYRATIGTEHTLTAQTLHNLAQVQQMRGGFQEAEALYREALEVKRRTLGNAHPSVTVNLNNLGSMLLRDMNRPGDAEPLIREALALDRRIFGERHGYTAESLRNLGDVHRVKGDLRAAEAMFRRALAVNRSLGNRLGVAVNLRNLGKLRHQTGDFDRAISLYRRSRAIFREVVGEEHRQHVAVTLLLADALRERGDAAAAEEILRPLVVRLGDELAEPRERRIDLLVTYGRALTDLGRAGEALPLLRQARALARERDDEGDWRTGDVLLALGTCLLELGHTAPAAPLILRAREVLTPYGHAQPRLLELAREAVDRLQRSRGVARRRRHGEPGRLVLTVERADVTAPIPRGLDPHHIQEHAMPSTSGKLSRARSLVLTVLLIGSALLGETALSAQQPSGTVTGTVADAETLQPVAGAVVGLAGTPHRVITGRGGQFRLDRVSPGSYTLEVRGLGFVDVTRTGLLVAVGETTDLGVIPLDLSPIVMERLQVTATKDLRSVGEVPALVSVVRREEMERGGKVELTQAIRNVPGLLNSALLQSFESVLLRGMPRTGNEFTTTLLLVDGVPQTDSRNSARVINLPINDVSAVEVVRGPNSALYGRTAIGGVVNVLTDEPTPSQTGHLELQAGEFGHLKGKGSISGPIDERFRYYLSGATGRGSGYFEQDFDYSIREHSGYAKLAVTPDARSDGMVSLNYVVSDNSVPTPIPVIDGRPLTEIDPSFRRYTNLNIPSANYHQEELRATLNYRRDLTDWLTFTEVFGYRRIQYKFEDDGDVIGAPFDLAAKTFTMYPFELQTDEDIIYQEARVQITPPLGVENGLLLGYSYEHNTGYGEGNLLYTDEETLGWPIRYDEPRIPPREEWQAFRFGGNDHRMGIHAVYAQYDIAPVDRLRLTAGARYDRADLRNRQTLAQGTPVIEDDFDAFSPKISGTLFLLRNRETPRLGAVNLNAYATYSEAFLPPRTPSGLRPRDADVKLQPEDVSNYEGGIKGDLLGGRLYFEAALFRMTRDGIVVQTREGPFFRPSNAGQQKFRGTEAGVTFSPVREVSVFANGAWYRHRFGEFVIQGPAGDRVLTGRRLPISPDRIYNAGVSWQSPWGIGAVLNVQRVGDRYLDQENTFLLDAYTLADAALSWRRGGVTLTLSAQNLFDAEYVTMGDISTAESIDPAPPRQLLLLGSYRLR